MAFGQHFSTHTLCCTIFVTQILVPYFPTFNKGYWLWKWHLSKYVPCRNITNLESSRVISSHFKQSLVQSSPLESNWVISSHLKSSQVIWSPIKSSWVHSCIKLLLIGWFNIVKTSCPSPSAPCGRERDDNWRVLTSHLISPALWGSKLPQPKRG